MSDWQPTAAPGALRVRAKLNQDIRAFFASRNVLEVETPILSESGNTEPNIDSFVTRFHGRTDTLHRERWLRTSPEFFLKRLLAAQVGDCYELGRVFRDGEAGGRHNPEFTMLEWYRVGWNLSQLIDECVELIRNISGEPSLPVRQYTFAELYQEYLQLSIDAPTEHLIAALGDIQIQAKGLTRDDWLDLLMTHRIQPKMPRQTLIAVRDFPASQAALARIENGVARRFELYWGGFEIANGYDELIDANEQSLRFDNDRRRRTRRGQADILADTRLVNALRTMPASCGVAIGVDRLMMVLCGTDRIRDVLAFDFSRS